MSWILKGSNVENNANMPMAKLAQWGGCATGLVGAAFVAAQSVYTGWGYGLWLISNFFLIAFGVMIHARGFLVLQAGYTATTVFGLLNCFFNGLATKTIIMTWAACEGTAVRIVESLLRTFPV